MQSPAEFFALAAWILLSVVWIVTDRSLKKPVRSQSSASRALHLAFMALGFVLLFWPGERWGLLDRRVISHTVAAQMLGAAVTWAGVIFAICARLYLGGNWSAAVTLKDDHTLIRSGPYSLVRHPIYSGLLLAVLGSAMIQGKIRSFVALFILFAAWYSKSRTEERFLLDHFGASYREYRTAVRALIPYFF